MKQRALERVVRERTHRHRQQGYCGLWLGWALANGGGGAMAAAALSSGAGWAGYGAVTGSILVWLLHRDRQRSQLNSR